MEIACDIQVSGIQLLVGTIGRGQRLRSKVIVKEPHPIKPIIKGLRMKLRCPIISCTALQLNVQPERKYGLVVCSSWAPLYNFFTVPCSRNSPPPKKYPIYYDPDVVDSRHLLPVSPRYGK